jgi:beta-glucosidase
LPAAQEDFIRHLAKVNPHVIVVTESGSSLALASVADQIPALLQMFYGGQAQGQALADVLFGDYNPSGRLPLTFYADDSQLPPMTDYDLTKGRTYMYLRDKPTYAFGYGLSYTTFTYANLKLSADSAKVGAHFTATVDVSNTGDRDGDEVVQGYVTAPKGPVPMPIRQLWAFQRVHIPQGQTKRVTLSFDSSNFGRWDKSKGTFVVEPGKYDIQIGAASDDIRLSTPLALTR